MREISYTVRPRLLIFVILLCYLVPSRGYAAHEEDLLNSVKSGDVEMAQNALKAGAKVNLEISGTTALIVAAQYGQVEIIQLLLEQNAHVNATAGGGFSALMNAAYYGHSEIVELLLAHGADVNAKTTNGKTALSLAKKKKHTEIVRLLEEAQQVAREKREQPNNDLLNAAKSGKLEMARTALDAGANVSSRLYGKTALTLAAQYGHLDIVRLLLEYQADVNAEAAQGFTALMNAAYHGHTEVVKLLLANGADAGAQTTTGKTALSLAQKKQHARIVQLLEEAQKKNESANADLLKAIKSGDLEMAKRALKAGADANANFSGSTPLIVASQYGQTAIAALLLEWHADVNAVAKGGFTALMNAAYYGYIEIVSLLLRNGADVNVQTDSGKTALSFARKKKHREVVQLLEGAPKKGPKENQLQPISEKNSLANLEHLQREGQQALQKADYQTALENFQKGVEQARLMNHTQYIRFFLTGIGQIYANLGQFQQALDNFQEVLSISWELDDSRGIGSSLSNIAVAYQSLGQYQQALKYHEQALEVVRQLGDQKGLSGVLTNIGGVYQNLGEYQKAMEYSKQALEIKREIGDIRGIGNNLSNIGYVYQSLGQHQEALEYHQQALKIMRDLGDKYGSGAVLTNIGIVYQNLSQYQKALEYATRALEIKQAIGDKRGIGNNLANIGTVYQRLGQTQQALEHFQQALKIGRKIEDKKMEGEALASLGAIFQTLGQYQDALDYSQQALEIMRKLGNKAVEGDVLGNIGSIYLRLGRYHPALEYYQQSLKIMRIIGNQNGGASILNNIGAVYQSLGQYQHALDYLQQALTLAHSINSKKLEGQALANLGNVYLKLGQNKRALDYYGQALEITREIGTQDGECIILNNIGLIYFELLGQNQQALTYFQQSLELKRTMGDELGIGNSLNNVGLVYRNLGQHQKAFDIFQESVDIFESLGTPEGLWRAQRGLATVEIRLNLPESAIIHYEQALDSIEDLRAGLTEKEHKMSLMQDKLYVYDELIDLLQDLHQKYPEKDYDRKSLEIFERKQGRVFLEEMGQSGARLFAGLPENITQQELELELQIEQTRNHLSDERSKIITEQNKELIQTLEKREQKLVAEQAALQEQIESEYPNYYDLKYPSPVTLEVLQQQVLQPEELLLIYGVMEEQAMLWLVGRDIFGLYPLAVSEEKLTKKVEEFRAGMTAPILDAIARQVPLNRLRRIAKRSMAEIQQSSEELSDLLLPAEVRQALEKAKTLYVVPTGALYGLPFEALPTPGPSQEGNLAASPHGELRYLVEDHAITYLSSASLLKILRDAQARRKENASYPLLAFANPVYNLAENEEASQAVTAADSSLKSLTTRAYLELMGGGFSELPETEEEVKEIRAVLNAPDESYPLHLREEAARSTVFQLLRDKQLDDYRYVIFSCHGILPGESTQITQPALVLSLPDPVTQQEDYLTMADVFGLELNAELVTLSACNTGRGESVKGEGVMGLTRAFMYAGTPAISITLWSVESQSAKLLSTGLYSKLQANYSRAEALRESKLRLIRGDEDSLYQHPFFWAPVVMFGDGR